jgi:hypothetical protein
MYISQHGRNRGFFARQFHDAVIAFCDRGSLNARRAFNGSSVTEIYNQVIKQGQKIPEYFAHVHERDFRDEVRKTSDRNRYIVIYTLIYVARMRYVGRLCIRLCGLPFSCNVSVKGTRSGKSHHFEFLIHWYMFTWTIFMWILHSMCWCPCMGWVCAFDHSLPMLIFMHAHFFHAWKTLFRHETIQRNWTVSDPCVKTVCFCPDIWSKKGLFRPMLRKNLFCSCYIHTCRNRFVFVRVVKKWSCRPAERCETRVFLTSQAKKFYRCMVIQPQFKNWWNTIWNIVVFKLL